MPKTKNSVMSARELKKTLERLTDEIMAKHQDQGALVGIHCCGNTDWSLLLKTKADIINFDAWGFFDRVLLYRQALEDFLFRDGILAWGIVPTSEFTGKETVEGLRGKLEEQFHELSQKGIPEKTLRERCLLTPSCGMALMPEADAEKAMTLLSELSRRMIMDH